MRRVSSAGLAALALLCGCRRHDFPNFPASYREFAYVSNGGSDSVTVLDLVHLRADRTLGVGKSPSGLAVNPERNEVYAVNSGSASVSVIDAEKNEVVRTIGVGAQPYAISVSADGRWGYVANSGANSVSVIDLRERRTVDVAGAGEKPGLARISPDGRTLVAANYGSGSVSIFETGTATNYGTAPKLGLRATASGCPGATDVAILPDSSKAFVACSLGRQVMVLSLASAQTASAPARADGVVAMLDVGRSPVALAMKPDGGEIFACNFDDDSISEIATGANEVGGTYGIGAHPSHGIVSADNSTLYVSNFGASSISIYAIDEGRALPAAMPAGQHPDALALSAEGHLLLAADSASGDVALLRTKTQSLFTMLPANARPNDIVVKAFTRK